MRIAGAEVEWQDKASQGKRRDRSNGRCESGRAKDKKRMEGAQRNGERGDQDRAGGSAAECDWAHKSIVWRLSRRGHCEPVPLLTARTRSLGC